MSHVARESLVGRWLRAPELDAGGGRAFSRDRGAPSRPRTTLELREDGTYAELQIGQDDRSTSAPGHWHVEGTTLMLTGTGARARPQRIEIVDAGPERLVLAWNAEER